MVKNRPLIALALVTILGALAGCPDDNKQQATNGAPSASSAAAPATSSAPVASSAPSASASEADSTLVDAAASATPDDAGKTASAADAAPAMTCGRKGIPDCPMQAWMKANTSAALQQKNFTALAAALQQVTNMTPPGYGGGWAKIANDGVAAAKAQDLDGVKASCRTCHNQFQKKYQNDPVLRPRKI